MLKRLDPRDTKTFRYIIGNDWPRARIVSKRTEPTTGATIYTVEFWYMGRLEMLDCYGTQLSPNPDKSQ